MQMISKTHKWGHWRYLVLNGRMKKSAKDNPTRTMLAVNKALKFLHLKSKQRIMFRNPYFSGLNHDVENAPQWLDYCIWAHGRMAVAIFSTGNHTRQKEQLEAKKRFLEHKKIPYAVLPRGKNYLEYVVLIDKLIQRKEGK